MSFVRRRTFGRRPYGGRSFRRGARRMGLAPAALIASRRTGATEMKAVDLGGMAVSFWNTGQVNLACSVPREGASFYNRIGRRSRARSLEIRGMITPSYANAAAVVPQFARIIVFYDRQPNGALPSVANVLADYNDAGSTATNAYCGINMDNRDRFLILRDRKVSLLPLGVNGVVNNPPSMVVGSSATDGILYHEFIKLKGLETHYKASTGAIGDIATGSYGVLVISSVDANTNAAWVFNFASRLKFFD